MNRLAVWVTILAVVTGAASVSAADGTPPGPGGGGGASAGTGEPARLDLTPRRTPDRPWLIAVAGAGLAAGVGLGFWLKDEADERFDLYLSTGDPARSAELFESAQRYDRASLIGWGIAQASFLGLFYLLTRSEDRPLVPVEGEPLVGLESGGVRVGWRWAP